MNFSTNSEKIKFFFIYLFLFLISDVIYSNFFFNNNYKSNCLFTFNNLNFLEKNCHFKQKYIRRVSPYNVYTDDLGLRFSGKKFQEDKENIFYFGDSFVYGLGLDYSKTLVGINEKKINKFNHLNFSLQGYSPTVYLYQLKEMIEKKIYPKKIFLSLDLTDVLEEARRQVNQSAVASSVNTVFTATSTHQYKNELSGNTFKKKNFKASVFIAQSVNNFFRNIKLFLLKKITKPVLEPGKTFVGSFLYSPVETYSPKTFEDRNFDEVIDNMKITLSQISALSKKVGAEFYILIYPYPDTMKFGQASFDWEKFAQDSCFESNCKKLINAFPFFNEVKNTNKDWLEKLFIDGDLHHSELGHTIISNLIIKEF
jgi:hypothetical protein